MDSNRRHSRARARSLDFLHRSGFTAIATSSGSLPTESFHVPPHPPTILRPDPNALRRIFSFMSLSPTTPVASKDHLQDSTSSANEILMHAVLDLRIAFCAFQSDNTSTISLAQLQQIINLMDNQKQVRHAELAEKIYPNLVIKASEQQLDDMRIDFKDFVYFFINHMNNGHVDVSPADIFRAIDSENHDEIDAKELEEALNVMGMNINAEEAKAMVSVADTSNDKHVSFPQFLNICTYIDHHLIEVDEQSRKK